MSVLDPYAICAAERHLQRIDNWITVKGQHIQINENGDLISGNPKVLGRKGNLQSERNGHTIQSQISATGRNEFLVKGFVNKQKLNNHWQNGRTHREEYIREGITTAQQYEQRALELIQMPCGNGILGYLGKDGKLCRYDSIRNDYVVGRPDRGIYTMFKPTRGIAYYREKEQTNGGNHGN